MKIYPRHLGLIIAIQAFACASQYIPQAFRGRMFDKTGFWALYSGGRGFTGPVLGPGTYFTGTYNELHLVQCSMVNGTRTANCVDKGWREFGLDVYVRFSANCNDDGVKRLLDKISPERLWFDNGQTSV